MRGSLLLTGDTQAWRKSKELKERSSPGSILSIENTNGSACDNRIMRILRLDLGLEMWWMPKRPDFGAEWQSSGFHTGTR
jgi:hypothetical protein